MAKHDTTIGLPPETEGPTLLIGVTGNDAPGITTTIFQALRGFHVEVLDVEQAVLREQLNLALLLGLNHPDEQRAIEDAVAGVCVHLGLRVMCTPGTGDNTPGRRGRLIVTILGHPLSPSQVAAVTAAIRARGANIDRIRRLSRWPVTTIQMDISGATAHPLTEELALVSVEHEVDIAVAPAGLARRGHRLVVMDVDSTLISSEVIDLLAAEAGVGEQVAAITARAMHGEIDFTESLRTRVGALAGLPLAAVDRVRDQVRLTPGGRTLCRTLRDLGFSIGLVSGGFAEIVEPLAAQVGAQYSRANRLEVVDGTLTGRLVGAIVDRTAKADALREFAVAEGLPLSRTVAIGDGANDLEMLATAGFGIAFNAKPVVQAQADVSVNVPYLDSVLYLLGISADDVWEAQAKA